MKEEGEKGDEKVPIFLVVVAGDSNYWFPVRISHIIKKLLLMYIFSGMEIGCFFEFLNIYGSINLGTGLPQICNGLLGLEGF